MKHKGTFGRRLAAAVCSALCLLACAARATAQGQGPRARKHSEYVNQFSSCDAGAYLDGLAIELQNDPNVSAYIRIYGPGGPDGKFAQRAVAVTKDYLVSTRGVEASRVEAVYGGPYKSTLELSTELWLVPRGAEPPPRARYKPDLKVEGKYAEYDSWDGVGRLDGRGARDLGRAARRAAPRPVGGR